MSTLRLSTKAVGLSKKALQQQPSTAAVATLTRQFQTSATVSEQPRTEALLSIISNSISHPKLSQSGAANAAGSSGSAAIGGSMRVAGGSTSPMGRFEKGDTYKPSDLSEEALTSKRFPRPPPPRDELALLKLNPVVEYKNATLLYHYISPLGRILPRDQTGLSAKNQRRLTKAVRRARAMCIISPTSKSHNMI